MALIQGGARANGTAEVVEGHLQVSQEHTPVGFVPVTFVAGNFTSTVAEALVSLQAYRGHAAVGGPATSHAVTAGKKLKIVSMSLQSKNGGAAQQSCSCFLRVNPTAAVVVSTPAWHAQCGVTTPGAVAGMAAVDTQLLGDYMILSGTEQFGVSQTGNATAGNWLVVRGFEYTE